MGLARGINALWRHWRVPLLFLCLFLRCVRRLFIRSALICRGAQLNKIAYHAARERMQGKKREEEGPKGDVPWYTAPFPCVRRALFLRWQRRSHLRPSSPISHALQQVDMMDKKVEQLNARREKERVEAMVRLSPLPSARRPSPLSPPVPSHAQPRPPALPRPHCPHACSILLCPAPQKLKKAKASKEKVLPYLRRMQRYQKQIDMLVKQRDNLENMVRRTGRAALRLAHFPGPRVAHGATRRPSLRRK